MLLKGEVNFLLRNIIRMNGAFVTATVLVHPQTFPPGPDSNCATRWFLLTYNLEPSQYKADIYPPKELMK
jgi:hypothetical protein